jgi:flagellar hook assembly protein FlgD
VGNESSSLDKTFTTLSETEDAKEEIDAKAYPNPCSSSKGNSMKFSVDSTTGGEVRIYTISGKLVKELLIGAGESEVNWDVLNEEGNNIKSGLYIYSITDGDGNKKTGKLAITQ